MKKSNNAVLNKSIVQSFIDEIKRLDSQKIIQIKLSDSQINSLDPGNLMRIVAYTTHSGRPLGISFGFDNWVGYPSWAMHFKTIGMLLFGGEVYLDDVNTRTSAPDIAKLFVDIAYGRILLVIFESDDKHKSMDGKELDGTPFAASMYLRKHPETGFAHIQSSILPFSQDNFVTVGEREYSREFTTSNIIVYEPLPLDQLDPSEESLLMIENINRNVTYTFPRANTKNVKNIMDILPINGSVIMLAKDES